jgi:hypothetical protein
MWESIKNFFGFGKKEEVVVPVFDGKAEPKVVTEAPKADAPKVEEVKAEAPKKPRAPKAKPVAKEESKVTAKDIKAKVKKEAPKTEAKSAEVKKVSKPRKPKSKE